MGCHALLQGIDPGIKPRSPALQADSLPTELQGEPVYMCVCVCVCIYIDTHIYVTGSLCCMPEPNTSLFSRFLLLPSIGAQVAHSAVLASAAQQSEPAVPAHGPLL